MITRRLFLGATSSYSILAATSVSAHHGTPVPEKFKPQNVRFTGYPAGRIIIDRSKFFLYWTLPNGRARRYGVGLGRAGLQLSGTTRIAYKAKWPSWTPTPAMIRRNPGRYKRWANGMPGGKGNPLGARALYLYRNGRDTYFRIHGTTEPWSIGSNASNGCVRMINDHVIDLYNRVPNGTRVTVIS